MVAISTNWKTTSSLKSWASQPVSRNSSPIFFLDTVEENDIQIYVFNHENACFVDIFCQ